MNFCLLANQICSLGGGNHHRSSKTNQLQEIPLFLTPLLMMSVFVCTGLPGPVGERHCACDKDHRTAGGHYGHPSGEHGEGELWQQDQ